MPASLKPGAATIRNGVPLLPKRGEKITLAHVQEILDDESEEALRWIAEMKADPASRKTWDQARTEIGR